MKLIGTIENQVSLFSNQLCHLSAVGDISVIRWSLAMVKIWFGFGLDFNVTNCNKKTLKGEGESRITK